MTVDMEILRAELRALAHECRALKNELGKTWTRPMADEQRRLRRIRWKVTERCILAACLRGKRHVLANDDAWHRAIAERVAKDYPRRVVEEVRP